jgi:hypothetical protein
MKQQEILSFMANRSSEKDNEDNELIDAELLDICRELIRKNLVTLKDIPSELANTIANLHYKIILLTKINYGPGYWPKIDDRINLDPFENLIYLKKLYNKLKIDVGSIAEFIQGLREIDRYNKPEEYIYCV